MSTDERPPEVIERVEPDPTTTRPRSRRSLLAAAAAAGGALATQALVRPAPVAAADVVLGAINTAPTTTTIRTSQASASAKALVGHVLTNIAGPGTAGVQGQSNAQNGNGVFGIAINGRGARGVLGQSANGVGVHGQATATTGGNAGVRGTTPSTGGYGVQGVASATSGNTYGVSGSAASPGGRGVQGTNTGTNGTGVLGIAPNGANAKGVLGSSTAGVGVYGEATGTSGAITGVYGRTDSTSGYGVDGSSPNSISSALGAVGVRGQGTMGVLGSGEYVGVQGRSTNYAVFGYTTPDTAGIGVYGRGAQGVKGRSYTGQAVLGDTDTGTGVKGEAYGNGGAVKAIWGVAFGANGNGVVAEANNGTAAYGVWGISSAGYAGVFSGRVLVTGNLSKGGGSFRIDHPLDPENKYLSHSFVESPDMMNIYNGNVVTGANGRAVVRLPRYFPALNRDFRYQLTVIGAMAQAVVEREIENGRFTIQTSQPGVKVSWQVTGIRKDPYANQNRIKVEENKPRSERGMYLHPKAYGEPVSAGVQGKKLTGLRTRGRRIRRDQELKRPA